MNKFIAIMNVIAWSGFWAFGYIALTSSDLSRSQITIAAILAGLGFLTGIFTYMRLCNVFTPRPPVPKEEG